MTRLWLVRHGETDWNRERRWQGQARHAPGLNDSGRAQAQALAARLDGRRFAALYSSDLARARETAGILAGALRLEVRLEPGLREINLGVWEGEHTEDIARRYPAEMQAREADPVNARAPGGESAAEVAARALAAAQAITGRHPDGDVLVVSHGLLLATLLCRVNGWPLADAYQHVPGNAEALVIEWPPG